MSTTKNPKDAVGVKKVSFGALSAPVMAEASVVAMLGATKYGRHNWRLTSVSASIYYDAAMRHLVKWFEGEETDPESGVSHLAHVICGLAIVRDAQMRGRMIDDRPPPTIGFLDQLQAKIDAMREAFPVPAAPVTKETPGAEGFTYE